jgi:DNA-binding transcriptional MerR regulator
MPSRPKTATVSRRRHVRGAHWALGFTLAEIEAGMPLLDTGTAPDTAAPALHAAPARKLADVDARIAGLAALRRQLARELERPGAGCPLDAQLETIA